jgi:mono/diheme cytochrome c family protein
MKSRSIALAASFAVLLLGPLPARAQDSVDRGRALVETNCARCHAVGAEGDSPLEGAPPFRTLGERYPIDALEEAFVGAIDTGHAQMPVFEATQAQIDDILDYIATMMEE